MGPVIGVYPGKVTWLTPSVEGDHSMANDVAVVDDAFKSLQLLVGTGRSVAATALLGVAPPPDALHPLSEIRTTAISERDAPVSVSGGSKWTLPLTLTHVTAPG